MSRFGASLELLLPLHRGVGPEVECDARAGSGDGEHARADGERSIDERGILMRASPRTISSSVSSSTVASASRIRPASSVDPGAALRLIAPSASPSGPTTVGVGSLPKCLPSARRYASIVAVCPMMNLETKRKTGL